MLTSLAACGNNDNSLKNDHNNSTHSTTSKKSSSNKKASQSTNSVTASTNSSTANSSNSDSNKLSDSYSAQLSDNDWYVLAYLNEWNMSISDAQSVLDQSGTFEIYQGTRIEQGTVDSSANLISTSSTTVTIAPSSGDGAFSTFDNVTLKKSSLIAKYINSQTDLNSLTSLTNNAVQKGIETENSINGSDSSTSDSSSESISSSTIDNQTSTSDSDY